MTIVNRPGAYPKLSAVDLTGIAAVSLLGETVAIRPTPGQMAAPTPVRATLRPTAGAHDLYFVFRNDQATAGQMMFIVLTATFERDASGAATQR